MDLSTIVHHRLHLHFSFITASSFADTRISSLPHRFRPNLIHHNPSSVSRADPGLSSIKSNSRKCYVAKSNLQEQTVVSSTTTMAWSEFARNVSGEWDGFAADFTPSGTPIELPEYVVPQAFRDWEVQVLDWQTQCPTLAQPHLDPNLNPKTGPPLISVKTIQLLPTVGCEADAATRYRVQERIVGGGGGQDNPVPAAFAYQSTGSYVALWPIGHELQQFELEYCLVNPLDRESRIRILLLLTPNNPKLAVQRIRVFSELWYGPFRNGEQLGGCAIRDSAFAATAPLKASQIVGIWQGPRAAATFDASDQSELPKQLLDGRMSKTVREELHLLLLPKQLWCSLKDSKDGETSFEVGWVYTHGCAVTSETIFSADAKLKEISIARETATVEGV